MVVVGGSTMKSSNTGFHLGDKVTEESENLLMPIINSPVHFLQWSYLLANSFAFQNMGSLWSLLPCQHPEHICSISYSSVSLVC